MQTYDSASGRTAEFSSGMNPQSSLEQSATRFNSQVRGFSPTSALDAYETPGFHPSNGNSATDAARQHPGGQIPAVNGISQNTYNALTPDIKTRLA